MGVDCTSYVVYGYKLPFDLKDHNGDEIDVYDGKYLPMSEGHQGEKFTIISDGMSGEYKVFGVCLANLDPYQDSEFKKIDIKNLSLNDEEIKSKCLELFDIEIGEPEILVFCHYS